MACGKLLVENGGQEQIRAAPLVTQRRHTAGVYEKGGW